MSGPHEPGSGTECREMFERISDYLDGDLPPDVCERYARHIEGCAPCVRFVESLRRAVRLVERSPGEALPDGLRREIVEAARRMKREGNDTGA